MDQIAQFKGQIGVYLSIPTISASSRIEPGTSPIPRRLAPLSLAHQLQNLYFVLYIKPVLAGITTQDLGKYHHLMEHYGVSAVVGPLLHFKVAGSDILVGEGWLEEIEQDEHQTVSKYLSQYGTVYVHSTEIIENLRKGMERDAGFNKYGRI